jgi:tRNA dimethylallyltransferase
MAKLRDRAEDQANRRTDLVPPVVIVAGATASGKSAAALEIAEAFGGTVINADSMQVYRELRVLTARPSDADMARAPHALYGTMPAADRCSVGLWLAKARQAVNSAHAAGRLPILVGGTGLYLRAFEEGLAAIPDIPQDAVAAAASRLDAIGSAAFHAEVAKRDPAAAERIPPSDRQRLIRAWAVFEHTGEPLSAWQGRGKDGGADGLALLKLLFLPERDLLYPACDRRFATMVAAGAVEEVEQLRALGLDAGLPAMRAVGVREIGAWLDGRLSKQEMIARGQAATRQYAKRQFTWFRRQFTPDETYGAQFSESLRQKIFTKIRYFG